MSGLTNKACVCYNFYLACYFNECIILKWPCDVSIINEVRLSGVLYKGGVDFQSLLATKQDSPLKGGTKFPKEKILFETLKGLAYA